jgi:hypothetical protein
LNVVSIFYKKIFLQLIHFIPKFLIVEGANHF